MPRDRWPDLCKSVEEDDGLPSRPVGLWTEEKLWFWNRYIEITTTAMVGKPEWTAGLVYVDLFAGSGVCKLKSSGRRIPGSALIAANAPKPFRSILLCEKDEPLANACKARLNRTAVSDRCQFFVGDCNELIAKIAPLIPDRALTVALIDPPGLDANFDTIRVLSERGRVDLLILFADAYDALRNLDLRLDRTLGPDIEWRERLGALPNPTGNNKRTLFADIYKAQLRDRLGYRVFGEQVMRSGKRPLYRLIYASKHDRGLEFWDKVTGRGLGGQSSMFES